MSLKPTYDTQEKKIIELETEIAKLRDRDMYSGADIRKGKKDGPAGDDMDVDEIKAFASNIAHDFNNALAAITGYVEKVKNDIKNESSVLYSLEQILHATDRAGDLTKQILSFSGYIEPESQLIDLNTIINNGVKQLKASLPAGVEVRKDILTRSTKTSAFAGHLHLLFMNLCTNAVLAMKERGGVLSINLTSAKLEKNESIAHFDLKAGDYLKLTIKDTGCGIGPDEIERIFEPYFTTMDQGEGYGLGLTIVKRIIIKCRGAITVDSKIDSGTTVTVFLPMTDGSKTLEDDKVEPIPGGSENILFVDDDRSLASLGKYNLEQLGYKVESITNPIKAMGLFRQDPDRFQLVITDMSMPNMTGEILARGIMQIRPDIPIILCTGYSELINEEKAISTGIREFLMKPISISDLARSIRMVLG